MTPFIPGIELSRRLYFEVVRPLLDRHHPNLPHAAGLLGTGSDILGFDDAMSTDHEWGPTVIIFLKEGDYDLAADIRQMLSQELPSLFYGYPVNTEESHDEPGTFIMKDTPNHPLNHRVFLTSVPRFMIRHLGFDIAQSLKPADWLSFPAQRLLGLTTGAVHFDNTGELTDQRKRFSFYPHDIWLYLLACGWQRIGQEEHLMPRAGFAGDELGSAIMGSRLVRDIMRLCFLMEKTYAPYPKWFGSAFKQLDCAPDLEPILWRAHQASDWQQRQSGLCDAYQYLARMHNQLGITEEQPETVSNFFGRPFKVIQGERFADAIVAQIVDPEVMRIAAKGLIGGIGQFSDSTDLRSDPAWRERIRGLYT